MSVSRQNEIFDRFASFGRFILPISTFSSPLDIGAGLWRVGLARRKIAQHLKAFRPNAVIELMPHIWSPFMVPMFKRLGARYVTIVHDAEPHPGDYRSLSARWMMETATRDADLVLTLSRSVTQRLEAGGSVASGNIHTLFHPDLDYGGHAQLDPPKPGQPVRLLILGRIMPYKGLPLFLDMVEALRRRGVDVEAGVMGEGALGASAARLEQLGAEVVNRWLTEEEIAAQLGRFHAVVLSHVEASQSGVAAMSLGAGLPVIATPVGGLVEQIQDGVTGVLAAEVNAQALADAVERLVSRPDLYGQIHTNIRQARGDRSVSRFCDACVEAALSKGLPRRPADMPSPEDIPS